MPKMKLSLLLEKTMKQLAILMCLRNYGVMNKLLSEPKAKKYQTIQKRSIEKSLETSLRNDKWNTLLPF